MLISRNEASTISTMRIGLSSCDPLQYPHDSYLLLRVWIRQPGMVPHVRDVEAHLGVDLKAPKHEVHCLARDGAFWFGDPT